MSARLSLAARPVSSAPPERTEFKGLMALLAGVELALVDIGTGLSMHSGTAKDYNMDKAKAALETALHDFKRGNSL
jgi:hypothetical protein